MYIIYFKYIWQFCQIAEVTKGVTPHYAPNYDKYHYLIRYIFSFTYNRINILE